ncbi:MAG: hypothetical protein WC959_03895 [Kiritimatiellales bacterium]
MKKKRIILIVTGILLSGSTGYAKMIAADDFPYSGPLGGNRAGFGWSWGWNEPPMQFIANNGRVRAENISSSHRRNFPATEKNQTVYFSFLCCVTGEKDGVYTAKFDLRSEAELVASIGVTGKTFMGAIGGSGQKPFGNYTQGKAHRIVGKLEFNAEKNAERLSVWVDPAGESDPAAGTVLADSGFDSVSRAQIQTLVLNAGGTAEFGDLRIGTEMKDVLP